MVNKGRPGDIAVPFISLVRGYRRFLAAFPDLRLEPGEGLRCVQRARNAIEQHKLRSLAALGAVRHA